MAKLLFILRATHLRERLGIMSLSAYLKNKGHLVDLLIIQNKTFEAIKKRVDDYKPDVIGYSCMTGEHVYCIDLNLKLKKSTALQFISIFGGPHFTFYPEDIEKEGVDIICRGEGEYAICELLDRIGKNGNYEDVRNLWVKIDNNITKNPVRPLIEDLDSLPFPDREIMYKEDPRLRRYHIRFMKVGRGCPYQCTYCFNHRYNQLYSGKGQTIRRRSVDNFIDEVEYVRELAPTTKFLFIGDDTFLLANKRWLSEFCAKYKKKVNLPFMINIRADLTTEKNIKMLRDAGLYSVGIGVECGDDEVSKNILKRGEIDSDCLRKAFKILNKYRILSLAENMVGMPVPNSLEIDFKTIKLNIECKPTYAHFSILFPFPRTDIYTYCINNHYFDAKRLDRSHLITKTKTSLNLGDSKITNQINNLHKFASIAAKFPFLLPLVKLLIKLRYNKMFEWMFFIWNGLGVTRVMGGYSVTIIKEGFFELSRYMRFYSATKNR